MTSETTLLADSLTDMGVLGEAEGKWEGPVSKEGEGGQEVDLGTGLYNPFDSCDGNHVILANNW